MRTHASSRPSRTALAAAVLVAAAPAPAAGIDTNVYGVASATWTFGADCPLGVAATGQWVAAPGEAFVRPELGGFLQVGWTGTEGLVGAVGPTVGLAGVGAADIGYRPWWQAAIRGGLGVSGTGGLGLALGADVAKVPLGCLTASCPGWNGLASSAVRAGASTLLFGDDPARATVALGLQGAYGDLAWITPLTAR